MPKYYGQWNPQVDQLIHEKYFPNKIGGISIECGAFDGIIENCTKFFEDNYQWKTINIEPAPNVFQNLVLNRPKSINLQIALSNNNETKKFRNYLHPSLGYNWGNGSISHSIEHRHQLESQCGINNFVEFDVKCQTYDKLIKELQLDHLDLFILDVEGHEVPVLEGMIECDVLPDVFVIEHDHHNSETLIDKIRLINSVQYKLDCISFNNLFFIKR
jgi:FkbM family methyltransferase